jgi:hypothetical protein
MRTTKSPTVHLRKKAVTDLPPELLSIIFKLVHDETTPIQLEKDIIPPWMRMEGPEGFEQSLTALIHPPILEDPNLKSPTLFPYSLAAVCSFWRNVLCCHPEFWTLVVLFIDSKLTPLVDASLFLEWSQKQHIHVFITRRDELCPAFYPDRHEKCQINAFLHILKPHLHRCRSLHVDANLSSSIPTIHKILTKIVAPHLESMELVCETHTDDKDDGDLNDDDKFGGFEPELTRLVIDGENFCDPSEDSNFLIDNHGLDQLTIAQYTSPGSDLSDLLGFLHCMGSLEQLKFESLRFPSCSIDNLQYVFTIPFVRLEDVSESLIANIPRFMYFEPLSVLRITRCPLPSLHNFDNVPNTLILEEISLSVDLLGAVTAWEGEHLWLDRCHSFSDVFLKALGHEHSLTGYLCSEMCRLLLHRLPKFSISLLKKMIKERNTVYVDYDDPDWKPATDFGPAISHLAVVQCGLGKLSAEDDMWFRAHLVEFYWGSYFFLLTYLFHSSHEIQSLEILGSSLHQSGGTNHQSWSSMSTRVAIVVEEGV